MAKPGNTNPAKSPPEGGGWATVDTRKRWIKTEKGLCFEGEVISQEPRAAKDQHDIQFTLTAMHSTVKVTDGKDDSDTAKTIDAQENGVYFFTIPSSASVLKGLQTGDQFWINFVKKVPIGGGHTAWDLQIARKTRI